MSLVLPSLRDDGARLEWWAARGRRSISPGAMIKQLRMNFDIDVGHLLPLVQAPTIVMHARDDRFIPIEHGRWMAERIPGARFIELDGGDHLPYAALADRTADEIEEFVTGARAPAEPERRLGAHRRPVLGAAQPSEVLVSHAIPPLVVGSGLEFEDRGVHELKGLSDDWHLFAARPGDGAF